MIGDLTLTLTILDVNEQWSAKRDACHASRPIPFRYTPLPRVSFLSRFLSLRPPFRLKCLGSPSMRLFLYMLFVACDSSSSSLRFFFVVVVSLGL